MKELEKKIEEAAKNNTISDGQYDYAKRNIIAEIAFVNGAKSPEAKEYWFSIFQSEKSETEKRLDEFIKNNFDGKPSYSEEEVRKLLKLIKSTQNFAKQAKIPCDIIEIFEQNKKK